MGTIEDLKLVLSDYEDHYAEALANDAGTEILKLIHHEIKELKEQLNALSMRGTTFQRG